MGLTPGEIITFTATADDGNGGTDTAIITINVGNSNNTAPEFEGVEQIIQIEDDMMWDGDTFEFDIAAGFSGELGDLAATDADYGDSLTWSINDPSDTFSIDSYTGTLSYYEYYTTGTIEGFWAYVTDGTDTDNAWVIVNFAAGNTAPVAADDSGYMYTSNNPNASPLWVNYFVLEGNTLSIDASQGLLENDYDPDTGDTLSAYLDSDGMYGSASVNTDGSFTYSPYSWVFDENFQGMTDTFYYYVEDDANPSLSSNIAAVYVQLPELTIQRTLPNLNTVDAEESNEAWIGNSIQLSADSGNIDLSTATFQWAVDGEIVSIYFEETGTVQDVTLDGKDLFFGWVDSGHHTVQLTTTVQGQSLTKTVEFDVSAPNITTSHKLGSFGLLPYEANPFDENPPSWLMHYVNVLDDDSVIGGVTVEVENSDDVPGGFAWTQTMHRETIRKRDSIGASEIAVSDGLDNSAPYLIGPSFTDSPGHLLYPDWFYLSDNADYELTLLFKHEEPGSFYVPVRVIHWGFSYVLLRDNQTGEYHTEAPPQYYFNGPEPTTAFPTWTNVVTNGEPEWELQPD